MYSSMQANGNVCYVILALPEARAVVIEVKPYSQQFIGIFRINCKKSLMSKEQFMVRKTSL